MRFIIQHWSFYTNNYKASTFPQPQGFRLVTPDPFLVRGLGVATRLSRFVLYRNIMGVAPSCCYKLLTLFSPLLNKENRHASALVLINSILEYCPHYSMYTVEYEDCFKLCALFLLAERGTKSETRAGRWEEVYFVWPILFCITFSSATFWVLTALQRKYLKHWGSSYW